MNPPPEVVMQAALDAFGVNRQRDKCLGEMAELTDALLRQRYGETDCASVIDEIADVLITVGQMRLLFGAAAVDQQVAVKLARLSRLCADQVQAKVQAKAKPEPKPKPALCWSPWQSGYLLLDGANWRGYVGHVNGLWAADTGANDRQWFGDSASAMREIERRNGLDEVPLWP